MGFFFGGSFFVFFLSAIAAAPPDLRFEAAVGPSAPFGKLSFALSPYRLMAAASYASAASISSSKLPTYLLPVPLWQSTCHLVPPLFRQTPRY